MHLNPDECFSIRLRYFLRIARNAKAVFEHAWKNVEYLFEQNIYKFFETSSLQQTIFKQQFHDITKCIWIYFRKHDSIVITLAYFLAQDNLYITWPPEPSKPKVN